MKKIKKIVSALVLVAVCALTCVGVTNVEAAGKAVKVTKKVTYTDFKEQMVVKGIDAKGKKVWSFKTAKHEMTELSSTKCIVKNDRVYVFEPLKVTVLKKTTGKKIYSKKATIGGSPTIYIDKKNNFYVTGYYGDSVYKYDSKGNQVWESNFSSTDSYWPYRMSLKKDKLTVLFDGETGLSEITFDAKTGGMI